MKDLEFYNKDILEELLFKLEEKLDRLAAVGENSLTYKSLVDTYSKIKKFYEINAAEAPKIERGPVLESDPRLALESEVLELPTREAYWLSKDIEKFKEEQRKIKIRSRIEQERRRQAIVRGIKQRFEEVKKQRKIQRPLPKLKKKS